MGNILELKTVADLNSYSFLIPSYQRGYKWTDKEVNELLNDIFEFTPRFINDNSDEKTWYCLQPIVVRKTTEDKYEVIDGQQRLTTIYLIQNYLNQDFVEKKRDKLFELNYQTRTNTSSFLNNLDEEVTNDENIDFFYISKAYKTIKTWFEIKENSSNNFDQGDFRSKLKFHSKMIWYESSEENPIDIFTRINVGKIPLTNAELIKALFLNSSNFDHVQKDKLRLKQLEIATEWDNIEQALQDDKLWYFLTGNKKTVNRIEFIFDLMNDKDDKKDPYATFRFFSGKFQKNTNEIIGKNWQEIKDRFQRFNEWYYERDLYHKIGFLITINEETKIKELYEKSCNSTKKEFRAHLDQLIIDSFKDVSRQDLQYGNKNVKKTLLLYNIIVMLNSPKDNSYFPFEIFKNQNWDIEHITSIKESMPVTFDERHKWIDDAKVFIDSSKEGKKLLTRIGKEDLKVDDKFKTLFEDIVSHFNSNVNDEDINDISNLTLLDAETNRSYKNAVFPLKRKTIIDRDKQGVFIPICTKNVFLKYFSQYPPKISFWTQEDRENYEKDLFNTLKTYLKDV